MKIPFWATIFTLIASMILISLSIWQVHRMNWKHDLLVRVGKEMAKDAGQFPLDPAVDITEDILKRGYLEGEYIHNKAIKIEGKVLLGNSGHHLVTPFKMSPQYGGGIVFVERGWVPQGIDVMNPTIEKPVGVIRIMGTMRPKPEYNSFVPENNPSEDRWYKIVPEEIAAAKGIDNFHTNIFQKEGFKTRKINKIPVSRGAGTVTISNGHAGYAVFWFAMFLAIWVVYILRFIAPQLRKDF